MRLRGLIETFVFFSICNGKILYGFAVFVLFLLQIKIAHLIIYTMSKDDKIEVQKQRKALLELILKRTKTPKKVVIEDALDDFVKANLDVVSEEEKKQFDRLVFA